MHMLDHKQHPFDHVTGRDWQFGVELSAPATTDLVGKIQGQCCRIWVPDFSEVLTKLEFEFNSFSRPVSISRNFSLVSRWLFRLFSLGFGPKTTPKCCTIQCHVDLGIKSLFMAFRKVGFLSTSISIKQTQFRLLVNESSMSFDHHDQISNFHAANFCFNLTFCECWIIPNFRSVLSLLVPL